MPHTGVGQQLAAQQEAYNMAAVARSCSACMNGTGARGYTFAKLLWSIKASDPGELAGVRLVDELALSRPKGLSWKVEVDGDRVAISVLMCRPTMSVLR